MKVIIGRIHDGETFDLHIAPENVGKIDDYLDDGEATEIYVNYAMRFKTLDLPKLLSKLRGKGVVHIIDADFYELSYSFFYCQMDIGAVNTVLDGSTRFLTRDDVEKVLVGLGFTISNLRYENNHFIIKATKNV
jgi:hypothetical protein